MPGSHTVRVPTPHAHYLDSSASRHHCPYPPHSAGSCTPCGLSGWKRDCGSRNSHLRVESRSRSPIADPLHAAIRLCDSLAPFRAFVSPTWIGSWTDLRHTCPYRSWGCDPRVSGCAPFVPVVKTANLRYGNDGSESRRMHRSGFRRILIQRQVSSGSVIVRQERLEMPVQRGFVEDDHVIQTLAAHRANHAFDVSSLPRRARSRKHFLDSHIV